MEFPRGIVRCCQTCKHMQWRPNAELSLLNAEFCLDGTIRTNNDCVRRMAASDPSDGFVSRCWAERAFDWSDRCGPDGKFWEPRQPKSNCNLQPEEPPNA